MNRSRWLALGTLALLVVGCEGQINRPPVSQLRPGMNILDARPDFGLNAAYVKGSRVIYLETRVGPLKPEGFQQLFPDEPAHEIDARFIDQLGNTFSVQRGGDDYVDPTWAADIAKTVPLSREEREASFAMAAEAASEIEAAGLPATMSEHVFAAAHQGRIVPQAFPELVQRARELAAQPKEQTYTNWYWHEADVYNKSVFLFGYHHAVLGWNYNYQTNTWDQAYNTCNHGSCAASMSFRCYTNSGWVTYPLSNYFNGEFSTSTGSITGACLTGYSWWTSGGKHNSNDDAWYEMWQIYNATTGNPYGQGGYDNGGNYFSCSCASSSTCDDAVHQINCYPSH